MFSTSSSKLPSDSSKFTIGRVFFQSRLPVLPDLIPYFRSEDYSLSRNLMVDLWTNFANFSQPNPPVEMLKKADLDVEDLMSKDTLTKLPPKVWQGNGDYVRIVDHSLATTSSPEFDKRMKFWTEFLKKSQLDL